MAGAKILLVDDDQSLLRLMQLRLEAAGYTTMLARSGHEALRCAQDVAYDLALVDLQMAGMDGMTLLPKLLQLYPTMPVIILTAHGTIASAVEATKHGAYDYLTKPFDATDLLHRLAKALEVSQLKGKVAQLLTLVHDRYHFENVIAASQAMQQVLHQVKHIAATDSGVALYGESGTGKELIAKTIHAASRRAQGAFVAINCGAIPEGLLENELFGHVKGAYTGADQARSGLLQQANGGTLFLDEIAELPLLLQVKLLRVLQEREFYPLGSGQATKVDFRLITATNQDLWAAVKAGRFREDLYYRVHIIPIVLPPLRERTADIPLFVHHFLHRFCQDMHKNVEGFSPDAMQQMLQYSWPGNVRELANVVERAVVLSSPPQTLITPELLLLGQPQEQRATPPLLVPFKDAQEEFERSYLVHVLTTTRGNVSQAATLAGRYRADFYKLLRKHAIDPGAFKESKTSK